MKPSNLIERLKELEAAATPGPWSTEFRSVNLEDNCQDIEKLKAEMWLGGYVVGPEEPGRGVFTAVDTAFIAEMRNALPKLLAVVEAAKWQKYVSEQNGDYLCQDLEDALAALEDHNAP